MAAAFQAEITQLRADYQRLREQIIYNYESTSYAAVQEEEQFNKQTAEAAHEEALEKAKRRYQVERRVATDEFNEHKDRPQHEVQRLQ